MAKLDFNPIQWHEGMLLMPQHFQQTDFRIENMMAYYMSQMSSFFWGIVDIKIDEALLTSGIYRPLELEVIMPDGLVISGLPETTTPLQLNLVPFQKELQSEPYYIYLCIPPWREGAMEVGGDLPRYLSSLSTNVMDMNTGEQPIDIPRLLPNLSLQLALEPPPHYVSLPLAQVIYDAKSFSLTNYLPPRLKVTLVSGIGEICNQLSERLRLKLGYLQQKVQTVQEQVTKDPFFEEIEDIRLKLIAGLLPFEALISVQNVHPFLVYRELCSLAGQISGVKYGELPPRFDAYNHLDISKSFSQVIDYITKVLNEIEESYTVIPFSLNDRVFTLQLQSAWVGDRLVIGVRAQPNTTTEDLLSWINNCVIVTDKYITLAKDNRVLGAKRTIVSEVPAMNLVATKGVQLFVVDVDPRYIDPKGILCLFNISDDDLTRPLEVVLYNSNQQALSKD
ncbi:MAG: type VI secretion system baseplate subunit TssK [Proteobacteria bacterium]|nr:type VI secretion system baseplate subunit TssK [Pseudomonadota bacterium]